MFEGIKKTKPLEETEDELYNDKNYSDEAEEYFLERFRNYMNNQEVRQFKNLYIRVISMSKTIKIASMISALCMVSRPFLLLPLLYLLPFTSLTFFSRTASF